MDQRVTESSPQGTMSDGAAAELELPAPGSPGRVCAYHFSRHRWFLYFWYGFTAFEAACALYAGYYLTLSGADSSVIARRVVFYAALPVLLAFFLFRPLRPRAALRVWNRLREQHAGECPWCRYDIHASPGPHCPECGKPIDPPSQTR